MTTTYIVSFDRVGRYTGIPDLLVEIDDQAAHVPQIEAAVRVRAGKLLSSRHFDVAVELTAEGGEGLGSIQGGRYGRFSVAPADTLELAAAPVGAARSRAVCTDLPDTLDPAGGAQ